MARSLGTRSRFTIAYLALGVLVGAVLGAFIVLVQRPGPKPAAQWSSWQPASKIVAKYLAPYLEQREGAAGRSA